MNTTQAFPRQGMKRKTIRTILRKKIDDWLSTIDNENLRDAIRRDVIVTGGSIASMLLGEKVNDFDIYFRTKSTTLAVARHYVERFNRENFIEVKEGVNPVVPYVKVWQEGDEGEDDGRVRIYIKSAGVAASNDQNSKYAYFEGEPEHIQNQFVDSLDQAISLATEEEEEQEKRYRPVFLSENAITLSNKMQVVIRFYGEPDEIHNNYDFVHAMNYYSYAEDSLILKAEALEALMSRTLIYKGSLYPICSLIRTRKFINRGWRISAGQILKMAFQVSELDLKNRDVLHEQTMGVDGAYFYQLIEALKDVDMKNVDSSYIATIIDRVFSE